MISKTCNCDLDEFKTVEREYTKWLINHPVDLSTLVALAKSHPLFAEATKLDKSLRQKELAYDFKNLKVTGHVR